jgi:hypothetical protein
MGRGSDKKRDGERDGRRERERGGEREREGGERCDFLVPLHDQIGKGQVVALAHIYVGGQGLLPDMDHVRMELKANARINMRVKDRRQTKKDGDPHGHLASSILVRFSWYDVVDKQGYKGH